MTCYWPMMKLAGIPHVQKFFIGSNILIGYYLTKENVAVFCRLLDTESVQPRFENRGPQRQQATLQTEQQILNLIENYPSRSTRGIYQQLGISCYNVHRTLREQLLTHTTYKEYRDYHPQTIPHVLIFQEAFSLRMKLCLLEMEYLIVTILKPGHISTLTKSGKQIFKTDFQLTFGLINNYLRPFVLPHKLTGQV